MVIHFFNVVSSNITSILTAVGVQNRTLPLYFQATMNTRVVKLLESGPELKIELRRTLTGPNRGIKVGIRRE